MAGYIWRSVKPLGATLFIRGIRTWEKDGPDERILQIQNTWGPLVLGPLWWPLPTIFLEGKPEYNHVSSTLIRTICTNPIEKMQKKTSNETKQNELNNLVPGSILEEIASFYCRDS